VLGLAEFIAGEEHRHALREQQRGEKIPRRIRRRLQEQ
jgi:hypothetical protein